MKFRMVWLGPDEEPDRQLPAAEETPAAANARVHLSYQQRGAEMVRREELGNGRVKFTPIANFSARIVQDIVCDDDAEQQRDFCLEAELAGQRVAFVVPAAEFNRMNWVLRQLGPQAIIYPGQQQHARAAIQSLSGPIRQERVFTHLGWTKPGPHWVYLQAGGPVGPSGTLAEYQVRLPASLQHYRTYVPADRGELVRAVRSSLHLLSMAPDRISLPLLAAVYRAPLGEADFSLFLTGRTGTFKTALASLYQQHFGASMDAIHLPANFAWTANALEELAFTAKDALLVVDDFAPNGGVGDSVLHAIAERLFRGAGNHQGRGRMSGQQLGGSRPPRALILATGEEVPRGHSLRARLVMLDMNPGDVNRDVLSECQCAGQQGQFAAAMGAYLVWIAGRYEELQKSLRARASELRSLADNGSKPVHARLPTTLAELQSAWEIWLQFALDVHAIGITERDQLQRRSKEALDEVAVLQAPYHRASDPALRFLTLLQTALANGSAHLADRHGRRPEFSERWGWRKPGGRIWRPQGTRIGWVANSDVLLEPAASYEVAQIVAGADPLPVSAQTLRHRLREHGLLSSVDAGRQMLLVRRTLEGVPRQVLHLKASDLMHSSSLRA